ncbi:MAG: histidine phosphatase family protein [Desulfuromonadales bacterium]
MSHVRRIVYGCTLMLALLCSPHGTAAQQPLTDQTLIRALQEGGYTIYFRHEATDWSQQDVIRQRDDWLSCDGRKVRQLSALGRQRAGRTGEAMRRLKIPVGEVLASPYCRAMETARQLGVGDVAVSTAVMNLRVAGYFGGREAIIAKARALLARPPATGSNRVIVAHGNVAQAATPVYPGEGEAVVFKADDQGGFVFVGRLTPDRWLELSLGH